MRLSLSPLTGQQYILLKNPDQYLEEERRRILMCVLYFGHLVSSATLCMDIFILQEEFYNYLDEEKEIDTPEEQTYQASDKTKLLLRLVLLSNLP